MLLNISFPNRELLEPVKDRIGTTNFGLKSFDCRTFAISKTSRFVIKYNLASFRNRVGVQSFFGRPITRLLFDPALFSCESRPCLRLLFAQHGDGGLVDRVESAELKMEDFAVDGVVLVGDGTPCDGIESADVEGLVANIAEVPALRLIECGVACSQRVI